MYEQNPTFERICPSQAITLSLLKIDSNWTPDERKIKTYIRGIETRLIPRSGNFQMPIERDNTPTEMGVNYACNTVKWAKWRTLEQPGPFVTENEYISA